jgi:3-hydroxybutyrate dehydrogenase
MQLSNARNCGRIMNVASTHGPVASAQKAADVASMRAIVGLTMAVMPETATSWTAQ